MRLTLIFLFSLPVLMGLAQVESSDVEGLELFHREKRITKYIPTGAKVVLSIGNEKIKGILEAIGEKDLTVNGNTYRYRDITWIGLKTKWTKSLAIAIGLVGLGIATAGVIYVASAGGVGFIGTGLIVAGGLGTTAVAVPLLIEGKRHYLDSDWKVKPPLS